MRRIDLIAAQMPVQAALAEFAAQLETVVDRAITIQQIPAPTFAEAERARFVEEQFQALGLQDVAQDELHNVYGRFPGRGRGRPVVLSAHLDTVFPPDTDLAVHRNGRYVYGPGIGDNATGVAGLITLADTLQRFSLRPAADVWLVGNVGEEGLGDLRGMRRVVERFGFEPYYIVLEGGLFGQIFHQAIGVTRFQIEVSAPGGHSWGSFGNASAVHVLGRLIAAIDRLPVPGSPKTTYNVGMVQGGTSINTIAQSAQMLLDLRSESPEELARLVAAVERIVGRADGRDGVQVLMTRVGQRPIGAIPRHTPLVAWAEAALRYVGWENVEFVSGSTDANIPLSQGMTAVCLGVTTAGHTHRPDEYIDITHIPAGLSQLLLLLLAAAGY